MKLSKIKFQPGIHREGTQYSAGPSWYDSDKIRFRKGRPEKHGGWIKYIQQSYKGVCRSLYDWATAQRDKYLGIGTNLKMYVERGGILYDITPLREVTAAGDVTFAASAGSSVVTVTDTDHGAVLNDYVTFDGAASLGGNITAIILNQEHKVIKVHGADSYDIDVGVAATDPLAGGDDGDGGTGCIGMYQQNVGLNSYVPSTGWGVGLWESGPWGGGGLVDFAGQLRLYSQDSFSDDLLFNPYLGNIYFWDVDTRRRVSPDGAITFSADTSGLTPTIEVTHTGHLAQVNDYVTYINAADLGGAIEANDLNQEYRISVIIDADTYEIEAKDAITGDAISATASDTGNGGSNVTATYGARRGTALEDLDGSVNPPTKAYQVMVSPVDRHIIAFACNDELFGTGDIDPLLIRWADQESVIDWSPSATNTAGGTVLSTGNRIIGAVKTRQEILVFTDSSIHAMRYAGAPYVYQFSVVGENITMISPKAGTSAGDAVFFMGKDGFYVFQGSVRRLPCSVLNYVFTNMDKSEVYKIYATTNADDNEVTWFYPANGVSVDVTNYVTYNYEEDVWTIGTFARGAWTQAPTREYPIASSNDTLNVETNYLYYQEYGDDAEGQELGEWLESGSVSLGDGDQFLLLQKVIPDFEFRRTASNANMTLTIKKSDFPLIAPTTETTKTITSSTTQLHVRVRAREIVMRLDGTGVGYGWTMGDFRFGLRTSAKR
jgi:hypothetical protein